MPAAHRLAAAVRPTGPAFDIVLLAHIACVLLGLVTVTVSGVQGWRLVAQPTLDHPGTRAYFGPGVNWAGRVIYGVPVFGLALLALSKGFFSLHDQFVLAGLGIFVVAALVAEMVLWPAERQVQSVLAADGDPIHEVGTSTEVVLRRAGRAMVAASATVVILFVLATVLMVAQP